MKTHLLVVLLLSGLSCGCSGSSAPTRPFDPKGMPAYLNRVVTADFSPDNQLVCLGYNTSAGIGATFSGDIGVWDVATGALKSHWRQAHNEGISLVAFVGDGQHLLSVGADGVIALWGPAAGKAQWKVQPPAPLRCINVALSPDRSHVLLLTLPAGAVTSTFAVYETATGKLIRRVQQYQRSWKASLSPGGQFALFEIEGKHYPVSETELWDVRAGQQVKRPAEALPPKACTYGIGPFTPDGKAIVSMFAAGCEKGPPLDRPFAAWSPWTGEVIRVFEGSSVQPMRITPDGGRVLGWTGDRCPLEEWAPKEAEFAAWDLATGKRVATVWVDQWHGTGAEIYCFSADGNLLFTDQNYLHRVYEMNSGRLLKVFKTGPENLGW